MVCVQPLLLHYWVINMALGVTKASNDLVDDIACWSLLMVKPQQRPLKPCLMSRQGLESYHGNVTVLEDGIIRL